MRALPPIQAIRLQTSSGVNLFDIQNFDAYMSTIYPLYTKKEDVPREAKSVGISLHDSLTASAPGNDTLYFRWYLTGPDGSTLVSDRSFRQSDSLEGLSIPDLGPGTYTLTVEGRNNISGPYSFRLLDLGAATALTAGTAARIFSEPLCHQRVEAVEAIPHVTWFDGDEHLQAAGKT